MKIFKKNSGVDHLLQVVLVGAYQSVWHVSIHWKYSSVTLKWFVEAALDFLAPFGYIKCTQYSSPQLYCCPCQLLSPCPLYILL